MPRLRLEQDSEPQELTVSEDSKHGYSTRLINRFMMHGLRQWDEEVTFFDALRRTDKALRGFCPVSF